MENACENHHNDWKLLVTKKKMLWKTLWKELQEAQNKVELLTLQTTNDWENIATENKTKATLYDEFIEQLIIEMGELLEEAKVKFKRWHFDQTGKYTNALDVAYECIWQLEKKDKEEKNITKVASEETTKEEAKQVSLLEEEDETVPIEKLIRKQKVVDPTDKGKTKEQKVENKDQVTNMDGKWVETRMRKMIYGAVAPRIKHPTPAEKASVKLYSKSDMVYMMLELEYVLPLLLNLETYYLLYRF
jgi:hypothetical protein